MPEPVTSLPTEMRTARYPWDEWLVPGTWKFTLTADFTCRPSVFQDQVREALARRPHIEGRAHVRGADVYVIVEPVDA